MAKTVCDLIAGSAKKLDWKHLGGCFIEDSRVNRTSGLGLLGGSWETAFVALEIPADDIPVSPITGCDDCELFFPCVEDCLLAKSVKNRLWKLFHHHKQYPNRLTALRILNLGAELNAHRELPDIERVADFFWRIAGGHFTHDDLVMGLRKTTIFL